MIDPNQDREAILAKAMAATKAEIPAADAQIDRPLFHFHAPSQWMNDPNGPIYYDGWYHMFYQASPFDERGGAKYWGHARSRDLINWEHLPIALWPSQPTGETDIYSGSCHLVNGMPAAFYTSIGNRAPEQWMAVPTDKLLIDWKKVEDNPVVKSGPHEESNLQEWRDPFLFDWFNNTYMITGGGEHGRGIVALYKATDRELHHWHYEGIFFHHPDADVANIECPNLARIDGKWVLLVSVHGRVESFVGTIDPSMKFETQTRDVLCPGSYASQLMVNKAHELIHWAWVITDQHKHWNGFITLPSKLNISADGHLLRNPVANLRELRTDSHETNNFDLKGERDMEFSGELLEVEANVEATDAAKFIVKFRCSEDGKRSVPAEFAMAPHSKLQLHLFLDRSVVDQYVDGGRQTGCFQFDADPKDLGLRIEATGGTVHVRSLKVHHLSPAKFTYDGW